MNKKIMDFMQNNVSEVRVGKDFVTVCVRRSNKGDHCFRFTDTHPMKAVELAMQKEQGEENVV